MIAQDLLQYSHTIGIYALKGRGFNNPVDLAFGNNGVIYVLNRAGPEVAVRMPYKRVTMCTVDEHYFGEFSSGGVGDGQMMWPSSIAIDGDGNVYVSDEALHRITVFDSDGQFLSKWGTSGSGDGELNRPAGIAFDGDGNLLVVDGMNSRVQRFTKDGRFLSAWGRAGSGDGEFNIPWGIHVDSAGNVYVADWRNDRIQKFDAKGKHLMSLGVSGKGDGEFHRPSGVATDSDGNIYVTDWGNERVQIFRSDGSFLAKIRGEADMSKWAGDYFEANTEEFEERQKADMEPALDLLPQDYSREESATIEKLFWGPTAVKIDAEGRVFVVDSCRHRIQIYQKR
ncbi:MAG: hypothetical protein IIC84_03350 [Chloroflexi bacterium]|nr:hypothetical protein [Chloroflexota bacterium]